jgi:hypothetical protein
LIEEILNKFPLPIALIIAEEIKSAVEDRLEGLKAAEATRSVIVRDQAIDGVYTLLSLAGKGRVREAVLILDKPDADIYVEADGRALINHSFAELQEVSDVMEDVDAFDKNGYYVIRLTNISFLSNCYIHVRPRKPLTIKQGLVLYNVI